MNNRYSGSCLCGEVRYEIEGAFERFYLCHCTYCRKDTGSAHGANLFSSTAILKWLCGAEKVKLFSLPSTRHQKCFCSVCGSALPIVQKNASLLVVPAGSLDGAVNIKPDAHIFVSSKANWEEGFDKIQAFDKLPA